MPAQQTREATNSLGSDFSPCQTSSTYLIMASRYVPIDDQRHFTTDNYEDWVVITEERATAAESPDLKHKQPPWYQGRMNRSVAEDHLSKSAQFDGTFIVRESDALSVRREPTYMISVLFRAQTHHVEVVKRSNGKYALANVKSAKEYKSLDKLIKHYRSKSMDLEGGGSCKLKYFLDRNP